MRRLLRIAVALGVWLAIAGCAAQGNNDSDNNQRGFYGGVSGGLHP
jgi:hypothetical protein